MKDNFTNDTDPRRCIPRKISWWHLAYVVTLLLVVLICVIVCLSKESVSDAAMDNVSFASSIVSIVLAVVSIVVSLYATFSTSANLGSMQDVARGIRRSLNRLKLIKTVADDNNRRLEEIKTEMLRKATPEEIRRKRVEEQVEEQVDADKAADSELPPPTDVTTKCTEEDKTPENNAISTAATSSADDASPSAGENPPRPRQASSQMLTTSEMADIEERAITKVGNLLGICDIKRDYNLCIDNMSFMFDGVYQSPTGSYTFIEVTIVSQTIISAIGMRLLRFHHQIQNLLEKMRPGTNRIYYVIVFRNNDKETLIHRISKSRHSHFLRYTPYLTILYFNLDEL